MLMTSYKVSVALANSIQREIVHFIRFREIGVVRVLVLNILHNMIANKTNSKIKHLWSSVYSSTRIIHQFGAEADKARFFSRSIRVSLAQHISSHWCFIIFPTIWKKVSSSLMTNNHVINVVAPKQTRHRSSYTTNNHVINVVVPQQTRHCSSCTTNNHVISVVAPQQTRHRTTNNLSSW